MLKKTGDERPKTGVASFVITAVAFGMLLLSACDPHPSADTKSDSVREHRPDEKNEPVRSLSVTPPVSPVPQQAADSIWNGDYVEKYPNGVVKKRGYIAGGLATGEWLTFYEDGKPWSRGFYRNGIRNGYGVSWHHDGQKSSEGYYNQGKPVGKWSYWSEYNHELMVKDYGGEMPDTTRSR